MKRSCFSRFLRLGIIFLFSFLFIFLIVAAYLVPRVATETLGPADDSLPTMEKTYRAIILLSQKDKLTTPNKYFGEDIAFQVDLGESAFSISQRLLRSGLIDDPDLFLSFLVYSGIDRRIQAGNYLLNPIMTPIEIAWEIQDATSDVINFTILAGWRSEEIALAIPYAGLEMSPKEFLEVVQANDSEGYLLPGKYTFPRTTSPNQMLNTFLDAFSENLTEDMEAGYSQQGFSIKEAVILASIIEREAVVEDEMSLIASVFINRIIAGMLLNADPTVQYALGYDTSQESWWTNPLTSVDLSINSPFNTYLYPGLPPGPICNPSINALRAVAFPAQTPYYYFRVSCDDSNHHTFSKTLDEHINNACP